MNHAHFSKVDDWIIAFDRKVLAALRAEKRADRPYPAENMPEPQLSESARRTIEGFMRINHAGEISAQALYLGQSVVARDPAVKDAMADSADEERDHLNWCRRRLSELGGRSSYLDPVWYCGSFSIGALAGLLGDKWSLGFIEETETQVIKHLQGHLDKLPESDDKTVAVLQQMQLDEAHHRDKAAKSGAADLPKPVKTLMGLCSKVMTKTAFWV